ncbi:MAG: DUF368 domain-containing protein [Bacteroidota bacterium]
MKNYFILFLKGIGMGAANVIPGVSGGTIALITGIFEKLIDSIKSFNLTAIKLLFKGKFNDFARHTNLDFLIAVFLGIGVSIISLAKILDYLFEYYPVYIWSFFFGLILASVYYVGKTITRWKISVIITFIIGVVTAVTITFLSPATENDSWFYLFLCGIVAICSMILPGLSGSFVLVLLGNYELVMIDAVSEFNFKILLPVVLGAGFGLLAFSYFLSWLLKKYKDQTIALLTGFILGSLGIIWPWKNEITQNFGDKIKVVGYEQCLPDNFDMQVVIAILMAVIGYILIWLLEKMAKTKKA